VEEHLILLVFLLKQLERSAFLKTILSPKSLLKIQKRLENPEEESEFKISEVSLGNTLILRVFVQKLKFAQKSKFDQTSTI